ncbi:MAG: tetratricopeptide repeat protein, partial [Roseiarcus sp.]|uniref:tetratricopeptide repeat protein n=1 Tax=Roseiarcus sp. TaxID=1969460 RepID=UPI003C5EC78B
MSDIFHEVDEEVRRDKAAEFWKKYQSLVLAGAALIVLAAAGFRYWQYERERAQQAAGDQFQQALAALE